MKKLLGLLTVIAALAFISPALAVCGIGGGCFWVGGTGTWDNVTTTHWASTSGGTGSVAVPSATDTVTFDGLSGGGTSTIAATINGSNTVASITIGAFTGTLDFSVNNPSITMGIFSVSGSGTRALKLGSGTLILNATSGTLLDIGTATNLTLMPGTSTIKFKTSGNISNQRSVIWPNNSVVNAGAGVTFPNIVVDGGGIQSTQQGDLTWNYPGFTTLNITNFTISGPAPILRGQPAGTTTISGTATIGGISSSTAVAFDSGSSNWPWSLPNGTVLNWTALSGMTFSGTGLTATNSIDLGGNSGITITGPSGGPNGGHCIGC